MKREIKFRVWDSVKKQWTFDFYFGLDLRPDPILEGRDMDDFIFQEFTGLKDKNGKNIYEGDILCEKMTKELAAEGNDCFIGQVIYSSGAFMLEDGDVLYGHVLSFSPDVLEDFYVIGNIFDNPELIRKYDN